MNKIEMPIYELFVEDSEFIGLALVDSPAIEQDFMFFSEQPVKMQFNEDKMMVKGPALIPNQLIYRNDALGERYVYFSSETIVKFVELLMSKEKNKFNLGHTDKYLDAVLIESYFVGEENEFGVPKDSWVVGLKVRDKEAWESIKNGTFKGFSVQSMFSNELVKLMSNNKKETMSNLKERLMDAINSVVFPTENVAFEETVVEPAEVEAVVPEVAPEVVEEIVEETIDEKLEALKEVILAEVDKRIEQMVLAIGKEVAKVDEKVEEFGKQPLDNKKVKEVVANPVKSNKASAFFSK
jgi:hypothetical protein